MQFNLRQLKALRLCFSSVFFYINIRISKTITIINAPHHTSTYHQCHYWSHPPHWVAAQRHAICFPFPVIYELSDMKAKRSISSCKQTTWMAGADHFSRVYNFYIALGQKFYESCAFSAILSSRLAVARKTHVFSLQIS